MAVLSFNEKISLNILKAHGATGYKLPFI